MLSLELETMRWSVFVNAAIVINLHLLSIDVCVVVRVQIKHLQPLSARHDKHTHTHHRTRTHNDTHSSTLPRLRPT
jgi:hypothetical protein